MRNQNKLFYANNRPEKWNYQLMRSEISCSDHWRMVNLKTQPIGSTLVFLKLPIK